MTRVAVIDDSAVVRQHLGALLQRAGMTVALTASDPLFAWPKMLTAWPDVIVLDVEMPRMDGVSFLRKIMAERPTPVVMCSTLTAAGAETTMQALAAGAVTCVTKPKLGLRDFMDDPANGLVEAVRAAAQVNLRALRRPGSAPATAPAVPAVPAVPTARPALPARPGAVPRAGPGRPGAAAMPSPLAVASHAPPLPTTAAGPAALAVTTDQVVAIGASTGGVQAIETVLQALPRTAPGVVIVQHMPPRFTAALAERLNKMCAVDVAEARDGDRVLPGRVLIAPGGQHMQLRRSGGQYLVEVRDGPLVNRHKPSVDVLLRSVAQCAGANAVGVILTGMGDDGARGLKAMHDAGAITAAQDEASSVVYGMPCEALRLGGAQEVLALEAVAPWLLQVQAQRG